jgi:hypothetical protein
MRLLSLACVPPQPTQAHRSTQLKHLGLLAPRDVESSVVTCFGLDTYILLYPGDWRSFCGNGLPPIARRSLDQQQFTPEPMQFRCLEAHLSFVHDLQGLA